MKIILDRDKPVSLTRQIRTHFEHLVRAGLLVPGMKLPATRQLATELGINRATAVTAYEDLVASGWARAREGQGTFVAARPDEIVEESPALPSDVPPRPAIDWAGIFSRSAQIIARDDEQRRVMVVPSRNERGFISFVGGMPDSELFPTEAFRRVLNEVVRKEGDALLQYYPVAGYPALRRYLSTYLLRFGLEASPDEILIVNGSQQGFDLIARTLIDPGDSVAIEQPTYPRAMQVFRSFGAQLLGVPWNSAGPRLDIVERVFQRHAPKFFYCQPSCHNPTGLAMSADTRRRLLTIAGRHQVPIVEDGFDGSLFYGARPPGPLKAEDRDGVAIYIGTFSKILFPGLRLGWLVAAPPVIERLREAKHLADLHTSALIQAAVFRFCERRLLDRHASRVAREYARRRSLLLAALQRRMPRGTTWTEPAGGFSLLVTLPLGLTAAALLPHALKRRVAFTPGPAFFLDGAGAATLRLSFSSVRAERIDEGVRRLADAVREAQKMSPTPTLSERMVVPLV